MSKIVRLKVINDSGRNEQIEKKSDGIQGCFHSCNKNFLPLSGATLRSPMKLKVVFTIK